MLTIPKEAPTILPYGRTVKVKSLLENLFGILLGVREDLDGILKIQQSLKNISELNMTYMEADLT